MRKPHSGFRPGPTQTRLYNHRRWQKVAISDIDRRGIVLSVWRKQRLLISFAVTAKLICIFVFAYAKSQFSHDVVHILDILFKFLILISNIIYRYLI